MSIKIFVCQKILERNVLIVKNIIQKNSQYNKIVYEAIGGKSDDDYNKDTKIIKKIAKNIIIDKIANNV